MLPVIVTHHRRHHKDIQGLATIVHSFFSKLKVIGFTYSNANIEL